MKSRFFSTLLVMASLSLGVQAHAEIIGHSFLQRMHPELLISWKVGDTADYKLSGGLINGTLHTFVREQVAQGIWIEEDVDLGMMGKEKIETLIDPNSGRVLEIDINGQKQTPPDPADTQIVDSHKDTVTVPKGTFDCLWVKIHDKKQNADSQAWVNPNLIPVSGMIKTIAATQLGDITIELTDFKKN